MKANDKAIEAARAEGKRWQEGLNRPENQIPCWKVLREADDGYDGYDVIAKFNSREERDKALERLRAEAMLTAAYAAQFQSEECAGLLKDLRTPHGRCLDMRHDAADALEAVLAEREAWKGRQEATAAILKQVETERDALKATVNAQHKALCSNAARLAPVEDEALVEIAAQTNYGKKWDDPENGPGEAMKEVWRNLYRKPLAAIRPHIEAAERERCAKIADEMIYADEIAEEIRSKK